MEQFIINGKHKLSGNVEISGSKNAALPIIAATVLINGKVTLKNIPVIKDILMLLEIIKDMGGQYSFRDGLLEIDNRNLKVQNPDKEKVKHLRASLLLLAPLLVRNKNVELSHPGGCLIGSRPIDIHLAALEKMGATIKTTKDGYKLNCNTLKPREIIVDFTVTGTENLVMAAVLTKGETKIKLAAAEPHVQDLCNFLNECGANITDIGTHTLTINGVEQLVPCEYEIIYDQIESGTFAIAATAAQGNVTIKGFIAEHHDALLSKFQRAGVNYQIIDEKTINIKPSKDLKAFNLRTEVYPGFPTDLQAPMGVLATQCRGTSNIHETIFEGRLGYIGELAKMGAQAKVQDLHHASITGPTTLTGTRITSFDLRAGATLIIAALIAEGESRLDQIEIIDRGYEKIEEKLTKLGAKIKRVRLKEIEA